MKLTSYPFDSWILEGIYLGPSPIHGKGVFSSTPITAGTVVIRWGGVVFTGTELASGKVRQHTFVGIEHDLYLANPIDKAPTLDDYMNHSCDGNLWMADEITLEAKRDIAGGEELTADYALWLNRPDYRMKHECNCRTPCCRRVIAGLDWQLAEVQQRNWGHFSPFINELMYRVLNNQLINYQT